MILFPLTGMTQIISTIAGTGTAGYNGDGILATNAQLNGVQGLALDAAGNIYIGDIGGNRVRKITISTGLISTIAGTGTAGYNGDGIQATTAMIANPSAMNFDANGDLYFTDRQNHRIRKITMATGIITTVAGTGTLGYNGDGILATSAQLNWPNEVSFDAANNMYIADWFNHRVRKVDKTTGIISTVAGTGTAGYNGDGILATAAQINAPCGIIFDGAGNTYFVELYGHRVRKISISTGLISTIVGTGTQGYNGEGVAATSAQLGFPAYIKFDALGNLYIGEGTNRVRKVDAATGLIYTIAGTGSAGYNGDGIPATTALLNNPWYGYFDPNNCNMYIADYQNNRVRKITGGFAGCLNAVAIGNKVSCQVLPAVTINNTNYNSWVPIYDSAGRIAAAINANGNVLGVVNTSLYTKNGTCREDGTHRLYLNRNITITPQSQPSSNVSVRLYIKKYELDSLRLALNSQGQPSGVASINEVDVFKNNDACATVGTYNATPLASTNAGYNSDYYLQVSVAGFSSFYFANKLLPSILPVKIYAFSGKIQANGNALQWQADCVGPVDFYIERSTNGTDFMTLGSIAANQCNQVFHYTDQTLANQKAYYRIRMMSGGQLLGYSAVIALHTNYANLQLSLPNTIISGTHFRVEANAAKASLLRLNLSDITGRLVYSGSFNLLPGSQLFTVDPGYLAVGKYWLVGLTNEGRTNPISLIIQ